MQWIVVNVDGFGISSSTCWDPRISKDVLKIMRFGAFAADESWTQDVVTTFTYNQAPVVDKTALGTDSQKNIARIAPKTLDRAIIYCTGDIPTLTWPENGS